MLKFKCSHCGGRLALHPRHLGRLARCPECGGVTHPMAQQILARQKPCDKIECDNCGHALGKLQKPRRWEKATVCTPCFIALRTEEAERQGLSHTPAAPSARVTVRTVGAPIEQMSTPEFPRRRLAAPQNHLTHNLSEVRAMARSAAAGLLLTVAALIVVTYVIRAMGTLLIWSAAFLLLALAGILIYRSYIALRRRLTGKGASDLPSRLTWGPASLIRGLLRST
jgi:predicted RNA-binding Zn-ribbon protein involved in translation (DUF1610 family)